MSENTEETTGISDEQLPEDLRPTDDNPLAKPLTDRDDAKSPEELDMLGGKTPEQSEGESEGGPEGDSEGESEG